MATTNLGRVAFMLRGTYSAGTAYKRLDIVLHNHSSYAAKRDTIGHAPPDATYWQAIADMTTADAAEALRVSAETARGSAEALRASAETDRAAAETAREEVIDALPGTITALFAGLGMAVVDGKLCVEVVRE